MNNEIKRFELAQKWILEAGDRSLYYYHKSLDYSFKEDGSVVTKADLEIETFLRKKINLNFPEDDIIGEEFENISREKTIYTWTIDPIDGTFSFAHKLPLFGNLIGLMKNGVAIMGLIYCPTLKEGLFTLAGVESTWLQNDKRSSFIANYKENFENIILSSSGLELIKSKKTRRIYSNLLSHMKFERSFGDCYGHLLVATGRIDFMFDPKLMIWDYVPLIPNLKAAEAELYIVDRGENKSIAAVSGHVNYKNLIQEIM